MSTAEPPVRVQYDQGDRLASADLSLDAEFETRLRRLHVRALHDTWGVAIGLLVGLRTDGRGVRIGPGLAYDAYGREIVLSSELAMASPAAGVEMAAAPWAFDLVCAYRPTTSLIAPGADAVGCRGGAATDAGAFRWAFAGTFGDHGLPEVADDVELGREVPLGRFVLAANGRLTGPDVSARRLVRPLLRPHVGYGLLAPLDVEWSSADGGGITATVDTSSSGFTATPIYLAALTPNPWATSPGVVGPFASLSHPARNSFDVRVLVQAEARFLAREALASALALPGLFWVGFEPFAGCPPESTISGLSAELLLPFALLVNPGVPKQ